MLQLAERFARYRQAEIDELYLVNPLRLPELKGQWCAALERARGLVDALPSGEVGCAYLDPVSHEPVTPAPTSSEFGGLIRHHGTVGGAWPKLIS